MSNSKTTHRPSEAVRKDIKHVNPDARLTYGRHLAAQKRYNILAEICIGQLTAQKGGEDLSTPENLGGLSMNWIDGGHGGQMAAAAQLVTVLEGCDAYKEAQEKLVPLLQELSGSEQAKADHAAKVSEARNAVHIAEEAAKAKALAAATACPELIKARKTLEKISN